MIMFKFILLLVLLFPTKVSAQIFNDAIIEDTLTMQGKTATTVPYLDASKNLVSSAVTPTELGYLSGVTSAIQTQFTGKEPSITATTAADYFSGAKTFLDFGTSVRASLLTGYVSGAGTLAATDTVLQAFNKLNGNILLKRDIADSSAYYVGPVGTGRPYTSIQAALTAMGPAVSEADFERARIVYISGGAYDESITIPRGRIITLVAEGTVILGDGVGANFTSTTPRSVTFLPDSADIFGSDIKPSLTIMASAQSDPTSTFIAEAGAFFISGNLNIDGSGVSHNVNLRSVKIQGAITKTTAGLTNLQGYGLYVIGASNLSAGSTLLERCFECEFDNLLTLDGYNAIINSELNGGMTVVANQNTLPPSGIFHSTLFGTYTGPAGMLKLDLASDYFFRANGATLGGAATKVILSPVATAAISGILSSTDFATFNGKQDALVNSAGLAAALNDESGTGLAVFNNSPTLITPALGTPSALVGTNITGTAAAFNIGGNAGTATALAANPSDCGVGEFATAIAANGNLTCSTPTGSGDVVGPAASVDSEVAIFSGITGKLLKRASATGVAKLTSGVLSASAVDLTSEVSGVLPGANGGFTEALVLGTDIAGFSSGAGAITSADTILSAINKLDGNIAASVTGVSSVFGRAGAVVSANGDYTASQVTNVAAGNIAAITVQAAINELDTEKQFVLTNSAGLASALSDETGTGLSVFNDSPAFAGTPTTPTAALGTGGTQVASQAYADASSAAAGSAAIALISNISGNTTGAGASKTYFGDTSGGAFTFTLPAAASFSGVKFMVKNISIGGANSITIARTGADTIEGGTSDSLAAGESQIYQSNGTSWYVE
jgi:hypothetical protein